MQGDRYRAAVRLAWKSGHEVFTSWPPEQRERSEAAVEALMDWLADADGEGELIARYLEFSDPPHRVVRPHLPPDVDPSTALAIEDECFWRSLNVMEAVGAAR